MKCIVLTGGTGERLWPLSRKNCPKQFIELEKNHSLFQDTIARNIPYCDEFIIVSNYEYRFIIENQLEPFQGLNYRCIYEKTPLKTSPAVILSCLSLQPTELVFVVTTNQKIFGNGYKEAILEAKANAKEGFINIFVEKSGFSSELYGYATKIEDSIVKEFIEKPTTVIKDVYKNLGFLTFECGVFFKELDKKQIEECKELLNHTLVENGNLVIDKTVENPISIEKSLLENSKNIKAITVGFEAKYIRTLEDLTDYESQGLIIKENADSTNVINASNKAVVVNGIEDSIVVSTEDAIYISKKGLKLKGILRSNDLQPFVEKSNYYNRSWGFYEDLVVEKNYRIRRIVIFPGKTIYEHKHEKRSESWCIISGFAKISIDGKSKIYTLNDSVTALVGVSHQISNVGNESLILVETSIGEIIHDMVSIQSKDLSETELGINSDPLIKLKPALKDYLWGGVQLKDKYDIETDMDIVAEAWELSAHPDGESVISSGRHKGLRFSKYIEKVGKEVLGWKCTPLQNFPMLVKFIDAKENLSIQVHPDDDYALEYENQYGKNEMWYVIDSKPGSGLYVGFNKKVTKEEVRERVKNNTITEVLNFYPTKAGDIFFIPAGTVHAICEGNLICEIQQSSNCTYRLYDYDRRDKYGNPRELHLDKALDVLSFSKYNMVERNVSCKYFEVEILNIDGEKNIQVNDDRFISIICIEGNGSMDLDGYSIDVKAGDSIFVPAQKGLLRINGNMKIAKSHI
jgi:mannose-6-phosphate isomerase class I/mannose-1-phosphate guanylyltransferase